MFFSDEKSSAHDEIFSPPQSLKIEFAPSGLLDTSLQSDIYLSFVLSSKKIVKNHKGYGFFSKKYFSKRWSFLAYKNWTKMCHSCHVHNTIFGYLTETIFLYNIISK